MKTTLRKLTTAANPYRADRIEADTHDVRDDLQREFGGGL